MLEKKDNSKKKYLTVIGPIVLIIALLGITYAWFNYNSTSGNHQIITGDIYMVSNTDGNLISLSHAFPETIEEARARDDNYITFDIEGLNTSSKNLYYEIILDHGEDEDPPKIRYYDKDLKFDLVELDSNGNEVEYLLSGVSYDTLINKRIYVNTIPASTSSEISKHYKVRMWVSGDVIISDTDPNRSYTTSNYKYHYTTIKVVVNGDLQEKTAAKQASLVIKNLASTADYVASYDDFVASNSNYSSYTTQDQVSTNAPKQTVYYYTGDNAAANANVLFAGYCWQIVRTTDNGGVRMIYNGVAQNNKCETTRTATKGINATDYGTAQSMSTASLYGRSFDYNLVTGEFTIEDSTGLPTAWTTNDNNSNGIEDYKELIGTYTCLSNSNICSTLYYVGSINQPNTDQAYISKYTIGNVAHFSQLGTSAFNPNVYSPAMVGYMFNTEYDSKSGRRFGEYYTTATWNGTTYDLTSSDNVTVLDVEHHYICDTDCTKVRYYHYVNGNDYYYILLENGVTVEDTIYQMTGKGTPETKSKTINANYKLNNYNSAIKGYLDNWYKKNLIAYTSYLDGTSVYCNDRSIIELGVWNPTAGTSWTTILQFYQYNRNRDLNCVNETDQFAVTNSKAKLTYPIGLLTEPERNLMTKNFAKGIQVYWGASPHAFIGHGAEIDHVSGNGTVFSDFVNNSRGVRGVITLKPDALFESGTGTYNDPYIVGPIVDRNS